MHHVWIRVRASENHLAGKKGSAGSNIKERATVLTKEGIVNDEKALILAIDQGHVKSAEKS